MIEIELSKKEAESLIRTLEWVMTACKMTEEDEEQMTRIIDKIKGYDPVSPGEVSKQ